MVSRTKLSLHRHILHLVNHALIVSRMNKVLIASPKDIAQLIVRKLDIQPDASLSQHAQEETLHLAEPSRIITDTLILSQLRQILLRSRTHVPAMLACQADNTLLHLNRSVGKHVVQEIVKPVAKQLAQPVVGHGLMQHRLHDVVHAAMVTKHHSDTSATAVIPALRTGTLAAQLTSALHYIYLDTHRRGHLLHLLAHTGSLAVSVRLLLPGAIPRHTHQLRDRIILEGDSLVINSFVSIAHHVTEK